MNFADALAVMFGDEQIPAGVDRDSPRVDLSVAVNRDVDGSQPGLDRRATVPG
jgi:hypothetical protein